MIGALIIGQLQNPVRPMDCDSSRPEESAVFRARLDSRFVVAFLTRNDQGKIAKPESGTWVHL